MPFRDGECGQEENRMKRLWLVVALASLTAVPCWPQNLRTGSAEDEVMFELIGQVKNSAMGVTPATSVQYGYVPYINGLTDEQTFAPGAAQNETTAYFTFFNDSTTLRVVPHGLWRIITREGTSTIYYNAAPHGDFAAPSTFKDGIPVQTSAWRHQVIFEPAPSGHFFVTFSNTITTSAPVDVNGSTVRLGKPGDQYRIQLVGGPDPNGLVNGKFAGNAIASGSRADGAKDKLVQITTGTP